MANIEYIRKNQEGKKRKVRIVEFTRQGTQMKMQTKVNNGLKRNKLNERKLKNVYMWKKVY